MVFEVTSGAVPVVLGLVGGVPVLPLEFGRALAAALVVLELAEVAQVRPREFEVALFAASVVPGLTGELQDWYLVFEEMELSRV